MKKIKLIIIALLIVIVILLIVKNRVDRLKSEDRYFYYKDGKIEEISTETELNDNKELENVPKDNQIEHLTDNLYYFVVKNCMQNYLKIINMESSNYYGYSDSGDYINFVSEREKKEKIYKLLSKEYIEKNNITVNNLFDYVDVLEENAIFVPIQIKQTYSSNNIKSFAVYGLIEDIEDYKLIDYMHAIVNIDTRNLTYSIEPIENINDIDKMQIDNNINEIIVNEVNGYEYQTILDEEIAKEYLQLYKKISLSVPEIIYERLDINCKNEKFNTIQKFKEYVNQNYDDIYKTELVSYLVKENETEKEYVLMDSNKIYYIFKEKGSMNFTLTISD